MRKLLFAFLLCCSFIAPKAFSQESTVLKRSEGEKGTYSFEKVYEASGKSQEEIYNAVKAWVVKNLKTQSNTNYFDDAGKSTVSTVPNFVVPLNSTVDFKLSVEIKDGKYKVSAMSFVWTSFEGVHKALGDFSKYAYTKKKQQELFDELDAAFVNMLTSIESAISSKSDW
jgi:hypothetical protein